MRRTSCIMAVLLMATAGMIVPFAGSSRPASLPETEPNDDFGSGNWMTLNNSYYGDVGYVHGGNSDQADYFRFNLSKNQDFSLSVKVSSSVEGMWAKVYNVSQQLVNSSLALMNGRQWDCYQTSGDSNGVWYLELKGTQSNYTVDSWTVAPPVDPIPRISIISPTNNSVVQNLLVNVSGNASDDNSVSSIYVFPEDAPSQNWTKATGTTQWNATVNISEFASHGGAIKIWAEITDTDGNFNCTSVMVLYNNHRPKVSIEFPRNNTRGEGFLYHISGIASDDKAVARVDVFVEDDLPARWTKATGTTQWNATVNISDYSAHGGPIKLWAHVEDNDGNTNGSYNTIFYYDNNPELIIGAPNNNSVMNKTLLNVTGYAHDDKPGIKVDVFPEGTLPAFWTRATDLPFWHAEVNISECAVHGGSIRIWATATDSDGNTNNTSVTVYYQGFSPIVIISGPENNSEVKGTMVHVSGTASDDKLVEKVDVAPEGVGPAFWTRASGTTKWNATVNVSGYIGTDGAVNIWAYVTDDDGNLNSTFITVFCNANPPDAVPPEIYITSPTEGQVFSHTNITVGGVVDDNVGVSSARLNVNQRGWQDVTIIPGMGTRLHWNISLTLPWGNCAIVAEASDRAGNTAQAIVNVTAKEEGPDIEKPVIAVTYPPNNSEHFGASIIIRGTAHDNVGIDKVEAADSLRQTLWQMATTSDDWHNWTVNCSLKPGPNKITFRATDTGGNAATIELSINRTEQRVDEDPPEVVINSPPTGIKADRKSITVSGIARDDFALDEIELWVNGHIKQTRTIHDNVTSANWSFTVDLSIGINKINVTAKDKTGKQGSAEITYTREETFNRPFPGFEALLLAIAMAIALAILGRKRGIV